MKSEEWGGHIFEIERENINDLKGKRRHLQEGYMEECSSEGKGEMAVGDQFNFCIYMKHFG